MQPREPRPGLLGACALAVLPWRIRQWIYRRCLGWEIDPSAYVGQSLLRAQWVRLGPHARIGHFNAVNVAGSLSLDGGAEIRALNLVNGCDRVELGEHAVIGYLNWVSGPPLATGQFPHCPGRQPTFHLGAHSTVVRQHRIECADAVDIGAFCDIGGIRSQLVTHTIETFSGTLSTRSITIGHHCLLNTTVTVQPGAAIPACTVVAPGSVVHGTPGEPHQFIGGVPAKVIRRLPAESNYFTRTRGEVE